MVPVLRAREGRNMTAGEREKQRLEKKIAALEHQVEALRDCMTMIADLMGGFFRPGPMRKSGEAIRQRLNVALATRPR
jgi:hypothetical protein